jgi:ubiquinone/menaquinone biosynthesis C-methylase UbiE
MIGVKMGERFAQIGCADGGRLGAVAAKVGLSGRAVAVVPDAASAARARVGAAAAGVLVEVDTAPPTHLSLDDASIDVVVVDDTGGLIGSMPRGQRDAAVSEALRILRPGGRAVVIGSVPRTGLAGLLARAPQVSAWDVEPILQANGFKSVRTLAERDGLRFVEAVRPRLLAAQDDNGS